MIRKSLIFGVFILMFNFGCSQSERANLIGSTLSKSESPVPKVRWISIFEKDIKDPEEKRLADEYSKNGYKNSRPDEVTVEIPQDFSKETEITSDPPNTQPMIKMTVNLPEKMALREIHATLRSNYINVGEKTILTTSDGKNLKLKTSFDAKVKFNNFDGGLILANYSMGEDVLQSKGAHEIVIFMYAPPHYAGDLQILGAGTRVYNVHYFKVETLYFSTRYGKEYRVEPKDFVVHRRYITFTE